MTPQQRAAVELFGFADFVPTRPDHKYRQRGDKWHDEALSFNDLVTQYEREVQDAAD